MFQVLQAHENAALILVTGETGRLLMEIALNYTLHQLYYDQEENSYYLQLDNSTVIYPEELGRLENLCAGIVRESRP